MNKEQVSRLTDCLKEIQIKMSICQPWDYNEMIKKHHVIRFPMKSVDDIVFKSDQEIEALAKELYNNQLKYCKIGADLGRKSAKIKKLTKNTDCELSCNDNKHYGLFGDGHDELLEKAGMYLGDEELYGLLLERGYTGKLEKITTLG